MLWGKGKLFPVGMNLNRVCMCVNVYVMLPLDTQSQYNSIMTLEGFLTLVGGAGVPHLTVSKEMQKHIDQNVHGFVGNV